MESPGKHLERAFRELENALHAAAGQRWHPGFYSHGIAARVQLDAMQTALEFGQEPE